MNIQTVSDYLSELAENNNREWYQRILKYREDLCG